MIRPLLLAVSLLSCLASQAVIIRHDVDPAAYEVRASDYPAVFFLERQGRSKVCVATVIHARWALTAAHCADQTMLAETLDQQRRFAVEVGGKPREIDLLLVHPDYDQSSRDDVDLALLRFRESASLPRPLPLHGLDDELGQVVALLGWGYFGRGLRGREYDDGRLRLAENRIVSADRRLRLRFDDPRSGEGALPLEGTPSLGDSGGPALFSGPRGLSVIGVAVGEIKGEDFSEETQGRYGATAVYERVSLHLDWIQSIIAADSGTSDSPDS